ncbi:hypothetical protein V1527DRAFT_477493 [Lipomyces starkeyi]
MARKIFAVVTLMAVLFAFGNAFENSRVCLFRACHAVSSKSECIGDYWYLNIDTGGTYIYGTPFYDNNVLVRGTLNHVQIQTQHGLRSAYLYLYQNDGAMGKTIAFVSYQNTAFHLVADDYFLDFNVYAPVPGGMLRNSMGTCGNPEADWKYPLPPEPLRPATGYALLDIPYDIY